MPGWSAESGEKEAPLFFRRLGRLKTAHDKTALQRQMEATDGQIDRLVYELYDLSDEEIRIVEEAARR